MSRVNGLELHRDQRFSPDSLISAGNSGSPLKLWMNWKVGDPQSKQVWVYNNSSEYSYVEVKANEYQSDLIGARFDFAPDNDNQPGNWSIGPLTIATGNNSIGPGESISFWIRLNSKTSAFAPEQVIVATDYLTSSGDYRVPVQRTHVPILQLTARQLNPNNQTGNLIAQPNYQYATGSGNSKWQASGGINATDGEVVISPSDSSPYGVQGILIQNILNPGIIVRIPLKGTFLSGQSYSFQLNSKASGFSGTSSVTFQLRLGNSSDYNTSSTFTSTVSAGWSGSRLVTWTPSSDRTGVYATILLGSAIGGLTYLTLKDIRAWKGSSGSYLDGQTSSYSWAGEAYNSITLPTDDYTNYEYNADTLCSITRTLVMKPFQTYSNVRAVRFEAEYGGEIDNVKVSNNDGLNWYDYTEMLDESSGSLTFPTQGNKLKVKMELTNTTLNWYQLVPFFDHRQLSH